MELLYYAGFVLNRAGVKHLHVRAGSLPSEGRNGQAQTSSLQGRSRGDALGAGDTLTRRRSYLDE